MDPSHPSDWNRTERNLYTKLFCALAAGRPDCLSPEGADALFACRNRLHELFPETVTPAVLPRPDGPMTIDFDCRLCDYVVGSTSPGEFADIALWGEADDFVTFEAKGYTDWSFEKDIAEMVRRCKRVQARAARTHLAHVLLISEAKWKAVQSPRAANRAKSNFARLRTEMPTLGARLCVVTYEEVAGKLEERTSLVETARWLRRRVVFCARHMRDTTLPGQG